MRVTHGIRILASLAVLVLGTHTARSQCPGSTLLYGALDPATPILEAVPSVDTLFTIQGCDRVHARYEIPAGLLIAAVDVACPEDFGRTPSGIETIVEDDLSLVGPAPGTPVSFSWVIHLRGEGANFGEPGFSQGGVRLRATLLEGASNSASIQRATSALETSIAVNEPLALPIVSVAGATLHVRAAVRAEAFDGRGSLEGLLAFEGLPTGLRVESCRGYASVAPVVTRAASWGRLKTLYR